MWVIISIYVEGMGCVRAGDCLGCGCNGCVDLYGGGWCVYEGVAVHL